jgi:hypothetical protein
MSLSTRRTLIAGLTGLAAWTGLSAANAHHGWAWADDDKSELTGVIKAAKLGNPHGILTVTSGGQDWTIEVGQPYRNEAAGLKDSMLVKGVTLTIIGNKAQDQKLRVMKAVRVIINGKTHDLYPERL